MPQAKFNPFDAPVGDRRWWYTEAYRRCGQFWNGLEPDLFSPHTFSEENEIKQAILEGLLDPRNEYEKVHRRLIAQPRPRYEWPKKWVTCKRCTCDWQCIGYPAGKQTKFTDEIKCHQLVDESGFLWFWPNLCQICADYREAKPAKPAKTTGRKVKTPIVD